jgi:PAS domain-containing protein
MTDLITLLREKEDWLLARVMAYADAGHPQAYFSALEEVWHQSFQGLAMALAAALAEGGVHRSGLGLAQTPDPVVEFGEQEARRHRERGVKLDMLLGLLALYRPAYLDLVREHLEEPGEREQGALVIDRFFDRVEAALCRGWAREADAGETAGLSASNLDLTLERDRFVTIFESVPLPIVLLDPDRSVRTMNLAASQLFLGPTTPGSWHYRPGERPRASALKDLFPTFFQEVDAFLGGGADRAETEWRATRQGVPLSFRVVFSRMLELPRSLSGILVILEDLTTSRQAEREREILIGQLTRALDDVRQLSGLLPICAWCKKIRDDKGYWNQIETYVASHSGIVFSHGICPDCAAKIREEPSPDP